MMMSRVNNPDHYAWLYNLCGIYPIDIMRHFDCDLSNVLKYVLRAGHKKEAELSDKQKELEDLKKARWYLNDKITMLEKELDDVR